MLDNQRVAAAVAMIEAAIRNRVFPAAVAEVGASHAVLWQAAFGGLTFDEAAPPARTTTIFDLASLTKPIATTSALMRLIAVDRLNLCDPVAAFFEEWRGDDREAATVQDLLEHSSGLAARLVDPSPLLRREFEHDICSMRLEYPLRSRSIYSDLGFLLLGFLAEDVAGGSLASQFDETMKAAWPAIADDALDSVLRFDVAEAGADRVAPTQPETADPRRGRSLIAEVHDDYAAALGGIAGHAGLFGTARGVGVFARAMLRGARGDGSLAAPFTPTLVARFTAKSAVPGSSRALGWDTMLSTSSCGTELSPAAFGHVGFTGTSLWIDPVLDRYFILLTNRACGGGTLEQMRTVRRAFHDSLARA